MFAVDVLQEVVGISPDNLNMGLEEVVPGARAFSSNLASNMIPGTYK